MRALLIIAIAAGLYFGCQAKEQPGAQPNREGTGIQTFTVKGVVREVKADERTVVVAHEAIAGYMDAMTMPFKVKEANELTGLQSGDVISFRLRVTDTESWIEQVSKTGRASRRMEEPPLQHAVTARSEQPRHPLLDYPFTNELVQAVSLRSFQGQALGITFFFTRCPIPNYCPRLSKNFEEASRMLLAQTNGLTNWHFLSVSLDPQFDSPAVLKAYGERYDYDPKHWSFLGGPPDKIAELARLSDVQFERQGSFISHNFRTLIIDARGHLQTVIPIGGDLSHEIVAEILKAAAITNRPAQATIDGETPTPRPQPSDAGQVIAGGSGQ
jgi:protein SCO1